MAKKKSKKTKKIETEEQYSLVTILAGIFLLYSLNSNSMGIVGNILQSIFKGLFGGLSFIIPIAIIAVGILEFFDSDEFIYKFKSTKGHYIAIFYMFLFYGLINKDDLPVDSPFDPNMLKGVINMGIEGEGPGFIATVIAYYSRELLGISGAYLVSIGILIILGIKFFNISIKDKALDVKSKLKKAKKENLTAKDLFKNIKSNAMDMFTEEVDENTLVGKKKKPKKKKEEVKNEYEEDYENNTIKIVGFNKAEDDYLEILEGTQTDLYDSSSLKSINKEDSDIYEDVKEQPIKTSKTYKEENTTLNTKLNKIYKDYKLPNVNLLNKTDSKNKDNSKKKVLENANLLEKTLKDFGVDAKVSQVTVGPAITRYEINPSPGVKVSKIVGLTDDIALSLAAKSIRMEAPIPGKSAIGIEVPNENILMVGFREVLESDEFKNFKSSVPMALGKDIAGNVVVADISKMPHLLIAGSTGSGKSVCINTLINSIIYKSKPDEVKLILIDPKVVELASYNGIPHLLIPVVTEPKKAANALNWAVNEMNKRYKMFAESGVKDINSYNLKHEEKLPKIVIIIDELADLMMVSANDVEDYICRLAQMARAAGMHLIVATQRPSVDVITGVIKANIPSRIAFAVSSQTDSRTILDMAGAEKLLGKGDMLFYPLGANKPLRIQGAFISEEESEKVVEYVKSQVEEVVYENDIVEKVSKEIIKESDDDKFLQEAINFVVESKQASSSMLQRKFKIGFNRAARLVDIMEERGIVGKSEGSKPRKVLITKEDLEGDN